MKGLRVFALLAIASIAVAAPPRSCRICNLADVNFDGEVDGKDLSIQLANYGNTVPQWRRGDLTGDRRVTRADTRILLRFWGCNCP